MPSRSLIGFGDWGFAASDSTSPTISGIEGVPPSNAQQQMHSAGGSRSGGSAGGNSDDRRHKRAGGSSGGGSGGSGGGGSGSGGARKRSGSAKKSAAALQLGPSHFPPLPKTASKSGGGYSSGTYPSRSLALSQTATSHR